MDAFPNNIDKDRLERLENLGAFFKTISEEAKGKEMQNLSDDIKLDSPKDRLETLQVINDVRKMDKSNLKFRKDDLERHLSMVKILIEKHDEWKLVDQTFSKMEKEAMMKILIREKEKLESAIFGIEIEISNKTIDIFENALAISDLEKTIESEK